MLSFPSIEVATQRILVLGCGEGTLDLLRLAVLRSDVVKVVTCSPSPAVRRFVAQFAVELHDRRPRPDDLDEVAAALIALGDDEVDCRMVREAWRRKIPVHVVDRPLVSDFSRLDLVAQRPLVRTAA